MIDILYYHPLIYKELTSWVKLQVETVVRQAAGAPYKRFLLAT